MIKPPSESTLAHNHPDHPRLADLASTQMQDDPSNAATIGQGGVPFTSPTQASEAESSTSSPRSRSGSFDGGVNPTLSRPGGFSDGPNARSKSVTVAEGDDTFGALNCHPAQNAPPPSKELGLKGTFRVGVSEDRNKKCRRTMEDAHSFVYDYAGVRGQGYFAVFDGHAGKHAAEWCGQNFHEYLLDAILTQPDQPIPDLLNKTFHVVDSRLSHLANTGKTQSGCTAVTAFLRVERIGDATGFINPGLVPRGLMEGKGEDELEAQTSLQTSSRRSSMGGGTSGVMGGASSPGGNGNGNGGGMARRMSGKRIRDFVRGLTGGDKKEDDIIEDEALTVSASDGSKIDAIEPTSDKGLRRVLYTANVGDARAVLCRGGKAVRLTYDHKGSDSQEAKRITDAGGFVMNNRVNGVLAVTRSLGDASMKEFVVGSPYTTETALNDDDEFLIVACDGLWDVCEDQEAVNIIRKIDDAQAASKKLLDFAITNYSTDNLSVMVVRFLHGK
ncbi:phosphatase 2C-domain-containing protein [Naematelia encephala]|uniref:Phosphatase 2C-domain-containing protein n=1 Tax=Naematelia encephala TaxID=71784 RepID=A0A1Y2AV59_9TREE|nr:phosphatase 2C-domain-containing protein [Naematelia encephala]